MQVDVVFTQMNSTSLLRLNFTLSVQPENKYLKDGYDYEEEYREGVEDSAELDFDYEEEYREGFDDIDDRGSLTKQCVSHRPHLYIIKDVSCCLDPKQYQCNSVDGRNLQCLFGPGN